MQLVGDPLDCGKFYMCLPGEVEGPKLCPIDRPYFNGKVCGNDNSVCCDEVDLCLPMCVQEATEVIDPRDCRKFYVCNGPGVPLPENHFTCPDGEVFDVFWGRCSTEGKCYTLCYD